MKIMLTGGSGFIGKNIIEALSQKHTICAPRHTELDLLQEDQVRDYLKTNRIDIVIHSATKPGHRNSKDSANLLFCNTRMFFNLARNDLLYKKMIFLSSGAVYDTSRSLHKIAEVDYDSVVPRDEHGFSKYICTQYLQKTDHIIDLRLFGVFGKYEDYAIRFISNAICKAIYDLPITLRQNRIFDYIFIDDFTTILDHFIQSDFKHSSYNITPTQSHSLLEIAQKVLRVVDKDLPIQVKLEGWGNEYSGDNMRLKSELNGHLFLDMEDSIERLHYWYSQHKSEINKEFLLIDK